MGVNLAVLLFCVGIGTLAVRFGRVRARSRADLRRLALLLGVVAAFLVVNVLAAWWGWRTVAAAVDTPAVVSVRELAMGHPGDPVVVAGRLSPRARSDDPRFPAYFACRGSCDYRGQLPLPVALDGGEAVVVNPDFAPRRWKVVATSDDESTSYLDPESPVVVVGALASTIAPAGLEALVVFAGTHEAFVARARRSRAVAAGLLGLDLLGALAAGAAAGWALLSRDATPR